MQNRGNGGFIHPYCKNEEQGGGGSLGHKDKQVIKFLICPLITTELIELKIPRMV